MNLGAIVLKILPLLLVAGVAYLAWTSNRRQRIALLLGWAFPGLGHWYLGHKKRAQFFAAVLVPTFLLGMILADWVCIAPLTRHPIWGLAQIPGGLMTLVGWLGTQHLKVTEVNHLYAYGCLYTGAACLLNIVALCDVWDLGGGADRDGATSPAADKAPESPSEAKS